MSFATAHANPTPAQEEYQDLLNKNTGGDSPRVHPEDRDDARRELSHSDEDEEDRFRNDQIDAAMCTPAGRDLVDRPDIKLPPATFDSGRSTGVKGVIADARSYEQARQGKWRNRVRAARKSVFGLGDGPKNQAAQSGSEEESDADEETFLQKWREARRLELENEARNGVRNRRTSPSLRMFGRFDTVDALGYLDAIEKVGRETVVVVFVYDHECQVSGLIESALRPLVSIYPAVHFIKVHYEDIEFDNAAVPTILAYKNQGDLFANMTGIIDMIPEDEDFDSDALKRLFQRNGVI
ncbi:thioredoxin-like protein [Pseudomassariella vexata]|uniref:Thioredoxin-like protein n=1 Tax=Pseudomassariella vexata TaxID=1141098 RepID=A0A1Y2EE82_9PEZI|nr:thioredoxin-like protein [Pseudomassariella vexata]ORY69624.1 thioredoxin-like protein [Pseudomassariella vexata]